MSIEFDISDLNEYASDLVKYASDKMPKVVNRFMKSEANKLKNKAKRKANATIKDAYEDELALALDKMRTRYRDSFKAGKIVYEYGDVKYNIRVYNSAPHAHLIEHGHRKITPIQHRDVGFVPGYHIIENAALQYEDTFAKNIDTKLVEKIKKELEK